MASEEAPPEFRLPGFYDGDLKPSFLDTSERNLGAEARQVIMFTQQPALSCLKL